VLQCVAVCCSVLQCVAVCCRVLQCVAVGVQTDVSTYISGGARTQILFCVLQCAALCCRVLQGVAVCAVCCSVLQCVAVCCSVLQCVAMCARTQAAPYISGGRNQHTPLCVAVRCSALCCVAVCCNVCVHSRLINLSASTRTRILPCARTHGARSSCGPTFQHPEYCQCSVGHVLACSDIPRDDGRAH